ncbi:MAG: radical SAM/SPASM domain-containing protein [Candidatus Aenigmatarchaeota archaeon]
METELDRLKRWKKKGRARPFIMDINPTDRCNLNCKSCWQRNPKFRNLDSSYELSDKKLVEIVKEGIDLGVEKFEITGGGEPLMRKDLVFKLMEKIKDNGMKGNLTTNGTLFSKKDLKYIENIGWDSLTFSVDGPNEKINDYLRGKGSFSEIKKSLNFLKKNKGEEPRLKFNTVISNKNYNKLEEMIQLAKKFNVEIVSFETLTVHSKLGEGLKLDEKQKKYVQDKIPEILEKAGDLGIETNINSFRSEYFEKSNRMDENMQAGDGFSSIPCYEPWYHIVIKVDGSVQPCCLYDSDKENVKKKSLEEIWFGDFFSKIRENMKKGKFSEYCKICNASQVIANEEIRREL